MNYFSSLKRIANISEAVHSNYDYLLLPSNINIEYFQDSRLVKTDGLGILDKKKDLIEIIEIIDPLNACYSGKRIFSPRVYLESLVNIPLHITVQGIFFTKPSLEDIPDIHKISNMYNYGKTLYDKFWIGSKNISSITPKDYLIIMNRRVGGWDGSLVRPVIELLGAGGHIPSVFDGTKFISLTPEETIKKEIYEELKLLDDSYEMKKLGGFYNSVTSELVILYGIILPFSLLLEIQNNSYGNICENIDGLYLGEFNNVIEIYLSNADPFAGGEKSKFTNFPSNKELMNKIHAILS
jgi:hypothetical protein